MPSYTLTTVRYKVTLLSYMVIIVKPSQIVTTVR
jgi:hypothetical protein